MSLINDALKRAHQAQQQKPPSAPPAQFRPVESAQRRSRLPVLVAVSAVVLLVGSGVLIGLAVQKRGATQTSAPVVQSTAQPAQPASATPAAKPAPTVVQQKTGASPAPANKAATRNSNVTQSKPPEGGTPNGQAQAVSKPVATGQIQQAAVQAAPPKTALPRLQGIFYRPDRPSAVLSGKVVLVGGSVDDFRVLAIQRNSVTIARNGQTNVLTLPE